MLCSTIFMLSAFPPPRSLSSFNPIPIRKLLSLTTAAAPEPQWRPTTDITLLCSATQTLPQTQQIHAQAILHGQLPSSVSISSALILSYANSHSHPSTLHALFSQTLRFSRSAFLHNTLIRAHTVLADGSRKNSVDAARGFLIYNDLLKNTGFPPDDHTFPFVLKLCADFAERAKGLEVHGILIKSRFDYDVFVNNTLLLFYGNCGDMRSVEKLFDEMPERDLITWNTVIRIFSDNNRWLKTVEMFKDLVLLSGFRPNVVTFVSVLPVCAVLEDEKLVRSIHCCIMKARLDSELRVRNALVDAYGKCGNVEALKRVFDEMVERSVVSWNSIVGSFAYRGFNIDALNSFRQMIDEKVELNSITIATILPALIELRLFDKGREIHGFSVKVGLDSDVFVANALIDMYGKWGRFLGALNVFYNMDVKNVVSWNSMIGNFAQNQRETQAIGLVREMQAYGEVPNSITLTNVLPACARLASVSHGKEIHARSIRKGFAFDLFVSNAITDMYAKCGCLDLARNVFDISLRDEVSYNILITGYSQMSKCDYSLSLFAEMEIVGMKWDVVSYMGVLTTCANMSAIRKGKEVHTIAMRRLFHEHLFVANSLLDFYTKCGQINIAMKVFERIPLRDAASWNTMILGFGMLGEVDTAIDLFEAMKEDSVEYDSVSYIAVLSACSHGGLVEKGKEYFDDMLARGIKPSGMHYACMVDLLGRCGLMEEAVDVIEGLPVKADANVWGALVGACRLHGNVELGCWAAEQLLELRPNHSGSYALLSNMYAEAGRWDEADRVRRLMNVRKVKKNPGCSWVQIQDQMRSFVVGQRFDPHLWVESSC